MNEMGSVWRNIWIPRNSPTLKFPWEDGVFLVTGLYWQVVGFMAKRNSIICYLLIYCSFAFLSAQSPVFAQMFEHPTKENLEGRIEIEDMETETMAEVLCFLYTGTSDGLERNDMETVVTLHQVADRYLIEQLGVRCRAVKALTAEGVTEDNVTDLWEEAEFYKLEEVKNAVKDFCWK